MESIREIYKIGNGPSSSHTMAPSKAAMIFKEYLGEVWQAMQEAIARELETEGQGTICHLSTGKLQKVALPRINPGYFE